MGTHYDTEQGGRTSDTQLDDDLRPWMRDVWDVDVYVTEFPYNQYPGLDYDPEEDEDVQRYLERGIYDVDHPMELPDSICKKGPFRTDIVGVVVDRGALKERLRRVNTIESLNGSGRTKRRRRRTYLSFVADGPMTRSYWEEEHGGDDEVRSYGEHSASRAFGWLKKRGFLRQVEDGVWDAVDLPLHIDGGVHAVELKIKANEWDTALEQASRADVFADYRWVAMDEGNIGTAIENLDTFHERGIGLLGVHPEDGVTIYAQAEECSPVIGRKMLDRYNVERWDLNERVLSILVTIYEKDEHSWGGDRPIPEAFGATGDILAEIDARKLTPPDDIPMANGSIDSPDPSEKETQAQLEDF